LSEEEKRIVLFNKINRAAALTGELKIQNQLNNFEFIG
jgi:hypothetical protein